ncbi:NAD(P)-dependent dehydrogenase (short-subunit alcohol dehydrogenase family) [Rhodococcus sp. SMB37]|uniref:SDR family NAD(P)-dependent oxidoreductase n=1 Tax=Rhodococcus sp. SMB37 TaxID=2512213 RepID=UPI0006D2B213|nr:SDR family oxidoreductase [Rhodococcus sp. SMB37]TCN55970.1 NAD(P)-dependent dehydrogenase (short-subunit alcohol dehydrogenase family) [Rhodococcus sp. SMB37]
MSTAEGKGRLEGKVAVVTGAGSGIGRASARLFAREGAKVVCADISGQEKATADEIGHAAVAVHVDVVNSADVQDMVTAAVDAFGRLDVLFSNAGLSGKRGPIAELDEEAFDNVVAVNLKGAFLGMKYAIPAMIASGGGSVINTASASALVGWKGIAAYSAAKGGVVQLTKSAALDYATSGIRVNAICPGMTWTGLAGAAADGHVAPPTGEGKVPPQPMKRWGVPQELANAALFLASDESSFITGTAIPVDGGYVAR